MRFRNWIVIEVLSGIGLCVFGYVIHNDQLFLLGSTGTMLPLFHNLIGSTFWFEHKLNKENKYAVEVLCHNCCTYTLFKIPNGRSIRDHVQGKICSVCHNEFKLKELST